VLRGVSGVRLSAALADGAGHQAVADAHFVAHYSANDQHIRVSTSTTDARVRTFSSLNCLIVITIWTKC
jgi:hypothetical protein